MLELKNITKDYVVGGESTTVLKGVSLTFRNCEFVSILGQSGCGKTTMLNIIGGLDKFTSGDLVINGKSTKKYKDGDWDTYRNHTIGFVFQSYNLIPHQTALKNVELALSIGGISKKERRKRAIEALNKVGLSEHIHKKPNQMSGGQCQRVSIARALVTNPDIILADEPTGALDSETSVQVMELLKQLAQDRLIIMVTHNAELAENYSTRIVKMLDGNIVNDSNPVSEQEKQQLAEEVTKKQTLLTEAEIKNQRKKSSMSLASSINLSGSNLLTKKRRTFITSLACSIGIIGIAVILSVSSGMQKYVNNLQQESASVNYISISATSLNVDMDKFYEEVDMPEYPDNTTGIYPYKKDSAVSITRQQLNQKYITYLEENIHGENEKDLVLGISYSRNIMLKRNNNGTLVNVNNWQEILNNPDYINSQYTTLATLKSGNAIPTEHNEVALVVDIYNRISTDILDEIGVTYNEDLSEIAYSDLLGKQLEVVYKSNTIEKTYTVSIVSILRQEKSANYSWIQSGIGYSEALTEKILAETDAVSTPNSILIYPKDFDSKDKILTVLDNWNNSEIYKEYGNEKDAEGNFVADKYKVAYIDVSEMIISMMSDLIDIITYALVAFSAISLIVSSIMIAIITYASVIERIKEIGTIRSLGGRKKDVSNIFIVEAGIIGVVSSIIALIATVIINLIINLVLGSLVGVSSIANLSLSTVVWMVVLCVGLNLIASLIPANLASKKDPVVALRTE